MGNFIKQIGATLAGTISGTVAAIGTSINIPVLGGAILTGAFPAIAAIALGCMAAYGAYEFLQQVDIVQIIPIAFEVEVLV